MVLNSSIPSTSLGGQCLLSLSQVMLRYLESSTLYHCVSASVFSPVSHKATARAARASVNEGYFSKIFLSSRIASWSSPFCKRIL